MQQAMGVQIENKDLRVGGPLVDAASHMWTGSLGEDSFAMSDETRTERETKVSRKVG